MKQELHPTKVQKIICSQCGELLLKLYPNHPFIDVPSGKGIICKKCLSKK